MRAAALIGIAIAATTPAQAMAAPRVLTGERARLGAAVAPDSQLERTSERRSFGARFERYRQVVGGVPVLGSEVALTDLPGRTEDLLLDSSDRQLPRPPPARLSRQRAVRVALGATRASALRARPRAAPAILPLQGAARLVWRVLIASGRPAASFEVLVDARSGEVLRMRDLLRHATGQALLFDSNPVVAAGSRGTLTDGGDADLSELLDLLEPLVLARLNEDDFCLTGAFVRATLPDGPDLGVDPDEVCASDSSRDFRPPPDGPVNPPIGRADPRFEALMAYFHVDRAQSYLRSLGFNGVNGPTVRGGQIRVNANQVFPDDPLDPDDELQQDNSFYDPNTKQISLGTGGTDDGEDGEVIVHEYGHAIQDAQVPLFGQGAQAGAIGEGFGDYFSAVVAKQSVAPPRPGLEACVAEWDALGFEALQGLPPSPVPCLRRVDRDLTAAQVGPGTACNAKVHCAGQAWSGALWDIRASIGAANADRLVIQSHFSLTPAAGFHEGSLALIAADQALFGGSHVAFLRALLSARGLLDVQRLDDTPAGAVSLTVPGERTGSLRAGADRDDVYALDLVAGVGVVLRLRSAAPNFDLRLIRPGSPLLDGPGLALAESAAAGSNEEIPYVAAASGRYLLDVRAAAGAGDYTLFALTDADRDARPDGEDNCPLESNPGQEDSDGDRQSDACDRFPRDAQNDVDRDGLGANEDNCPRASNRRQTDWDRDKRGDVCDRSARISLKRLRLRGRKLTLRATLRPTLLRSKAVAVSVDRRKCRRCRYRRVTTLRRGRSRGSGRVDLTSRLRRGSTYRFRALLRDRRYRRVSSRTLVLRLR